VTIDIDGQTGEVPVEEIDRRVALEREVIFFCNERQKPHKQPDLLGISESNECGHLALDDRSLRKLIFLTSRKEMNRVHINGDYKRSDHTAS
jgi:hypothetical protein